MAVRPPLVRGFGELAGADQVLEGSTLVVRPAAGATVSLSALRTILVPAGLLASLTLALPASPADNQRVYVTATQTITALTITGGTVATGAITTLLLGGTVGLLFVAATGSWYRIQ